MELSRLMHDGAPFRTNIPVYASAANLLLRGCALGRTPSSGASATVWVLTVPSTTASNKDAIGILQAGQPEAIQSKENMAQNASAFRIDTSDNIPNRLPLAGNDWLPAIINPEAIYAAVWDQTSANIAQADITASTGLTLTVASLEDDIDGSWVFSTDSNASATVTFSGSLRYATASAASVLTLATAMNVSVDSDLVVLRPWNHRLTQLDSSDRYMRSTIAAGVGTVLHIHDNFIRHAGAPDHPLRQHVDDGLNGLNVKTTVLYSEVVLLDHAYRAA